jgi:predicted ester cyclase
MSESNKALARKAWEAIAAGELDLLDEYYAPELVSHAAVGPAVEGRATFKKMLGVLNSAFHNMTIEMHEVVAEGDYVASRFNLSFTHAGDFMSIPATNRDMNVEGMDMTRISGGKIVEVWGGMDQLSLLMQIGGINSPS